MSIKSAKIIISTNPNWSEQDPDVIEAMHIYAIQFLDEAIKRYKELPSHGGTLRILRELKEEVK